MPDLPSLPVWLYGIVIVGGFVLLGAVLSSHQLVLDRLMLLR